MTLMAVAESTDPGAPAQAPLPARFDLPAVRGWRAIEVSPSYTAAVPIDVHMPHLLTCKAINRAEPV